MIRDGVKNEKSARESVIQGYYGGGLKLRVRIDPQHLSKALKRSHYPLSLIDDVLLELEDVKIFRKIHLKEGYLQTELDDK